jgi:hypothetical protein
MSVMNHKFAITEKNRKENPQCEGKRPLTPPSTPPKIGKPKD